MYVDVQNERGMGRTGGRETTVPSVWLFTHTRKETVQSFAVTTIP